MAKKATKHEQYRELLKDLEHQQLLGTFKLGELTRTCTHRHYKVTGAKGRVWGSGTATNGQSMRKHIAKAVNKWLDETSKAE